MFFFLRIRRPPRSTRTDTLFPYTTLFRSKRWSESGRAAARDRKTDAVAPLPQWLRRASGSAHHRDVNAAAGAATLPHLDRAAPRWHAGAGDTSSLHPETLCQGAADGARSEEHTSELQSLMRISYAVFCLKKKILNRN